ncbi:MAG: hypothetical protein GXP32_01915 [Kiritimatiellaeota bacterium]|nr:hypothetical protein [Kiritimatiellota bacterium]
MKSSRGKANRPEKSPGTAEKTFVATIAALKRWDTGENLDELVDSYRNEPYARILTDLLFNYFRNKGLVDHIIARLADSGRKRPVKPDIFRILASLLTQCFFQTGIKARSAVNVAVGLTRKSHDAKVAGFVNAVARRAIAEGPAKLAETAPPWAAWNIPKLLFDRWGPDSERVKTAGILAGNRPPLSFRVVKGAVSPTELAAAGCRGLELPEWANGCDFHTTEDATALFASDWLATGRIYIQDPATAAVCSLCELKPNNIVIDICAAPGGKTLLLAEKLPDGALLVSADSSSRRHARTSANLAAAGFATSSKVAILAASALSPPLPANSADLLLLDAPCANTGVYRSRPDALWRFTERKLRELTAIQRKMLDAAAELIKPGGSLVYSTCSLEKEENAEMVERFLRLHPNFRLEEELTLIPCPSYDGAYAARLRRSE